LKDDIELLEKKVKELTHMVNVHSKCLSTLKPMVEEYYKKKENGNVLEDMMYG